MSPERAIKTYDWIVVGGGITGANRELNATAPCLSELDTDIQFRELDLLLTISAGNDPEAAAAAYAHFAIPPKLLSVAEACTLEPLLNPDAIAGALSVKHGHIQPEITTQGYTQAFVRLHGVMQQKQVLGLLQEGDRITGVKTATENYHSANVVICGGGLSRHLLKSADIPIRLYFTEIEQGSPPLLGVGGIAGTFRCRQD